MGPCAIDRARSDCPAFEFSLSNPPHATSAFAFAGTGPVAETYPVMVMNMLPYGRRGLVHSRICVRSFPEGLIVRPLSGAQVCPGGPGVVATRRHAGVLVGCPQTQASCPEVPSGRAPGVGRQEPPPLDPPTPPPLNKSPAPPPPRQP